MLIIGISIYIKNRSTIKEAAKWHHHISTVGQHVALLRGLGFYPDISAHIRKM